MNSSRNFGLLVSLSVAVGVAGVASTRSCATTQGSTQLYADPPKAALRSVGTAQPAEPIELRAKDGEVAWTATIQYTDGTIFNPRSGTFDKVRLRSYQGEGVDPNFPFVAPTMEMKPGETLRLTIRNRLPKDDPTCPGAGDVNVPHCFNSTNMHTHGWWINPSGNSDNVLIKIDPGIDFTYEYNLPNDHPAGTFWYHPHLHGSTALQVGSGMAGALVVHGDRVPTPTRNGDVDTLLKGPEFRERLLVLSQIPYACRDAEGNIKTGSGGEWICGQEDVGTVGPGPKSGWPGTLYDLFGPGSWQTSGRFTTVNGRVLPVFDGAKVGDLERWRLIHAGVRDSINLRFSKLDTKFETLASAEAFAAASKTQREDLIRAGCQGTGLAQMSLATDGLTRDRLVAQENSLLQPGYREDLIMVFPEPGVYCILDDELPANQTIEQQIESRKVLGFVVVTGTGSINDIAGHVRQVLVAAARRNMPADMRPSVIDDLNDKLRLTRFQPHPSLMDVKPDGYQTLGFRIIGPADPTESTRFEVGELGKSFAGGALEIVNSNPYDPNRIDRDLILENVDEWTLASFLGGHPFHIHVNPFQVISVLDDDGKDVSGYAPGNNSPYARTKGTWKDTLFVTQTAGGKPYRITVRTKYRRYIGDFVLHCHILDHEDQGMMQNVRISVGAGSGGPASSRH